MNYDYSTARLSNLPTCVHLLLPAAQAASFTQRFGTPVDPFLKSKPDTAGHSTKMALKDVLATSINEVVLFQALRIVAILAVQAAEYQQRWLVA